MNTIERRRRSEGDARKALLGRRATEGECAISASFRLATKWCFARSPGHAFEAERPIDMDEPKRMALAAICLCCLIGVAFFAAFAGQTYSSAIYNPGVTNQTKADEDAYYQQTRLADNHVVIVGEMTIVVGFIQAIALVITLLITANVAIRQLRAYIYPGQILISSFAFNGPMILAIDVKNGGNTPARNVEIHGSVFIDTFPLKDDMTVHSPIETSSGRHSRIPLYPGEPNSSSLLPRSICIQMSLIV